LIGDIVGPNVGCVVWYPPFTTRIQYNIGPMHNPKTGANIQDNTQQNKQPIIHTPPPPLLELPICGV